MLSTAVQTKLRLKPHTLIGRFSTRLTSSMLLPSHHVHNSVITHYRKLDQRRQPVDTRAFIGVPVHSFKSTDATPLPDDGHTPVLLQFRLMPTSFLWRKGQRIRVSIGGADVRHFSPLLTGAILIESSTMCCHNHAFNHLHASTSLTSVKVCIACHRHEQFVRI
jgi:hypothetical protein